jgi:hypothetical protein
MPGQCSTSARAKKLCDYLHFVPGCAPESSAFLWPHRSRMLLLPSSVASTRSSWVAENSQPVIGKSLSCCRLNKQRLINSLEAEVNESACLIELSGVTPPYKISRFHVRRAKLGVASQGQSLTPEALARHRVPRVALVSVTAPAKRTQGVHGPQCASVKGLSPVMRRTVGADML